MRRKNKMKEEQYCKCKGELVLANLKIGKGKCPICGLPKKLGSRLKKMSKRYKDMIKEKKDEK